jgi:hypothetical protein
MVTEGLPICRVCGRTLGGAQRVVVCGRTFSFAPMVCDACAEARESEAETQRKNPSRWERMCPALYQCTDIRRLENDLRRQGYDERWIEEVLAWQYEPCGLVLNGPAGVGKSRVIWQLLRRLLGEEHRTGTALNAVTFRGGLQSAACESATEEFVGRLVRTDVLYWDDLGQMHLTGPVTEMLLHLVEQRACAGRPILLTTQYSGEELDAQFERPQMGVAIRRRLNEFCRVVTVRQLREQRGTAPFQPVVRR